MTDVDIKQFDFDLPEELIAQSPLQYRDASRMLVVNREQQKFHHEHFTHIVNYFNEGDCLVLNDTRVLPARLFGIKKDTGANIEILLLTEKEDDCWEVLAKPARKLPVGSEIIFGNGKLHATCVGMKEQGGRLLKFHYKGIFYEILNELGDMPLPPYIKEKLKNDERYQTVYAKEEGSAAAPTAGLHFTHDILDQLRNKGVLITYITLHVGLGTFRPVTTDHIEDHQMHEEVYHMSADTAQILTKVKENNGNIIAVGTTSTRVLETIARDNHGQFVESTGATNIFIYPPYNFQAIDGLITNFHLPKSTLIMLVSALVGKELTFKAYSEAIEKKYRFFSFGDAMLILP